MISRLTSIFDSVKYKGYHILLERSGCWIFSEEKDCYVDGPFKNVGEAMFKIDQYLD